LKEEQEYRNKIKVPPMVEERITEVFLTDKRGETWEKNASLGEDKKLPRRSKMCYLVQGVKRNLVDRDFLRRTSSGR